MLSNRQLSLLDLIIKEHVQSARPVSSGLVAKRKTLDISSATIRNEMQALEDAGYLKQLHTSGGRVPTDKAYRYFVNNILASGPAEPTKQEKTKISQALTSAPEDPKQINRSLAEVLSDLSEQLVITGISDTNDFFKVGLSSLFGMPEFRELDRIFQLTSVFDHFDRMFDKIEREFFTAPVESMLGIYIGHENPLGNLRDETMIVANYPLPENTQGSLTLIGPTRMDYERNMALINYAISKLYRNYE